MQILTKVDKYILEYTAYDLEPLYLIISALISDKLCKKPLDVVDSIIRLVEKKYLAAFVHSGESGAEYIKIEKLDQNAILANIGQRNQFETYPNGEEYFFKTSESGMKIIAERNH